MGNTSMEVKVEVYGENLLTGEVRKTNEAYLTYVALDRNGNPTQVPMLYLNTDEERKEFEKAVRRREMRLKRKNNPEGES